MKKTLIALITGLFALGLIAASPGGAGTNDYSSGFGFWQSSERAEQGSIGYEAIGTDPTGTTVTAEGEFDYRQATRSGQGGGFHAQVVCLNVDGDSDGENDAIIGLVVEESNAAEFSQGDTLEAKAVDNGDGRGDEFDLREANGSTPLTPEPDCEDDEFDTDPIRGNIVVEDGGFAGGRS